MARIYVRFQHVTYDCGHITVSMTTNKPSHLWLLFSTAAPGVVPHPYTPQPSERPHGYRYQFYVQGIIEQTELGETLTHTFFFSYPYGSQQLFFYAANENPPSKTASRTPLNAYALKYKYWFGETWSRPNQPDFNWQYNGGGGITSFESGGGSARLVFSRDSSATLFTTDLQGNFSSTTNLCNVVAQTNVIAFPPPLGGASADYQFTISTIDGFFNTDARNTRAVINIARCAGVGAGPAAFTEVPGRQQLQLGDAFSTLLGKCGHAYGPHPPDSTVFQIAMSWISGNNFIPGDHAQVAIGPVSFLEIEGELEDISASWRRYSLGTTP
jgi:hypothetical protein